MYCKRLLASALSFLFILAGISASTQALGEEPVKQWEADSGVPIELTAYDSGEDTAGTPPLVIASLNSKASCKRLRDSTKDGDSFSWCRCSPHHGKMELVCGFSGRYTASSR